MKPMNVKTNRNMKTFLCPSMTAVLFLALAYAATAVGQVPAFVVGNPGQTDGHSNDVVGFVFKVNQPMSVSDLGFWDSGSNGLNSAHDVGIYRQSDRAMMVQGTVAEGVGSPIDDGFRYVSVPETILEAGESYQAVAYRPSGSADRVGGNFRGFSPASEITILRDILGIGTGRLRFATIVQGQANGWFGPNFKFDAVPEEYDGIPLRAGETYLQDFDTALGTDGTITGQTLPTGWYGSWSSSSEITAAFPEDASLGRDTLLYNAGGQGDPDRALAIGIGRNTTAGTLQLVADVADSSANAFRLAFDVEAWDAGRVTTLGEAAFDVTLDLNTGDGFAPLVELGRVTTGATLFPSAGDYLDGNAVANRVSFDSGLVDAAIPADSQLRIRWAAASDAAIENWIFGLDNVSFSLFGDGANTQLLAGDADQDLDFDQLDLVQIQIAGKYLTGQAATWGEGDWDGAPGGSPGNPPGGDGLFNQFDIIAAQQGSAYLTGPYAAISPGGQRGDRQTSVIYDPSTGEVAVDAPSGTELTSVNIDSATGIFTGESAQNLGGSFDNGADGNIFKATFGSSFGSLSFGKVAQAGLSEEFVLGDLTVIGSLAGGGDLGNVDLVYVPEPATVLLLSLGLVIGLVQFRPTTR